MCDQERGTLPVRLCTKVSSDQIRFVWILFGGAKTSYNDPGTMGSTCALVRLLPSGPTRYSHHLHPPFGAEIQRRHSISVIKASFVDHDD